MIVVIKDKWKRNEDRELTLAYIEVPDNLGADIVEYIEHYEYTCEDSEYTLDDLLYYIEKAFDINTDLGTVNISTAYF